MLLKRLIPSALAAVFAMTLLVPAAFAHGGCHGRRSTVQSRVTTCTVEDCELTGRHYHGSTLYCGYDHATGVCNGACLALCPVEDCELTGRHTHDGVTYCGYGHEDGFCDGACLALCPVEGCALTGLHTHNGVTYCGTHHEEGFCGGGCAAAVTTSSRGHHGCH